MKKKNNLTIKMQLEENKNFNKILVFDEDIRKMENYVGGSQISTNKKSPH